MRRGLGLFFLALGILGLTACQLQPTRVTETAMVSPELLIKNAKKPLAIDTSTIVIDARSAFDYSVAHVPGAVNLQWEDFARPQSSTPGRVTEDLAAATRRLALYGVGPDSRVVVVGQGREGKGEEGRLAWTLYYMGLRDVQVASVNYFKTGMTNAQPPPRENVRLWQARPLESILATREEVLAAAVAKLPEPGAPRTFIVDVRTRKEYFSRKGPGSEYETPELRALHIPFQEFFLPDGRVNLAMRENLLAVGMGLHDRILIISNKGVRSGAVNFAMLAMGFVGAANYAGGYTELTAEKSH